MGVRLRNYENPPIPQRYHYIEGNWNDGFVIERNNDGSQFVWVPVGILNAKSTLDGRNYKEQFGRKAWEKDIFSSKYYHEDLTKELLEQIRSVKKYGGFYISRYNISKGENNIPQSVKGKRPWTELTWHEARSVSNNFENDESIKSHLIYGAEYDTVLSWFMKINGKANNLINQDSTKLGNHLNSKDAPHKIVETGSREEWSLNRIYDFAGNVYEMTQEEYNTSEYSIRGACYKMLGFVSKATSRVHANKNSVYDDTGFRIALCIAENAECQYI